MRISLERAVLDRGKYFPDANAIYTRGSVKPAQFAAAAAERYGVRVPTGYVQTGYLRKLPDGRIMVSSDQGPGTFRATWTWLR